MHNRAESEIRDTRRFFAGIKKAIRIIEKKCDKYRRSPVMADSLLTDNLYLISRSASSAMKELSGIRRLPFSSDGVPVIYEYIYSYCRYEQGEVTAVSVTAYLENTGSIYGLSFAEAAAVLPLMKACCVEIIASEITSADDGASRYARRIDILRLLQRERFPSLTALICRNEKLLLTDSVYSQMDERSRAGYRSRIEEKARREGKSEETVILEAFKAAEKHKAGSRSHFGFELFGKEKHHYVFLALILPPAAAVVIGLLWQNIILAFASLIPLYIIIKALMDFCYPFFVKTSYMPRLELTDGCPKTLITYITFFDDTLSIDRTAEMLDRLAVTNKAKGLMYGFLADLKKNDSQDTDKDSLIREYAEAKLRELNEKRGNVFFGAIRKRSYNFYTKVYEGHERKRGAVSDFLRAVSDGTSGDFVLLSGDVSDAVYFTSLDGDTLPEINSVIKLVGVLEHPFSQPVLDEKGRVVTEGYGIAAPRMELRASAWSRNAFTRLFGGFGGAEVYADPSFSVYPALYGEGIFAGKGVIRISLFNSLLDGEIPENRILSHDAVESGYLRTAYVSDAVFADTMPADLPSYLKRAHRWMRGDIQNASYIGPHSGMNLDKPNPFSLLTRYKLADSIIRAVSPVILAFTLHAAFFIPYLAILPLVSLFIPFILACVRKLSAPSAEREPFYSSGVLPALWRCFLSCLAETALLPAFAYNAADAVTRACVRLIKGDRTRLLEWTTAAEADKQKNSLKSYSLKLWPQLYGIVLLFRPVLLPLGVLWLAGAVAAVLLPRTHRKQAAPVRESKLPEGEISGYLSDIWKYFKECVNAENNWLPPDNFQEEPLNTDINRTSPTNIGLTLLTLAGGCEMGFVDRNNLYGWLDKMISTIERLEKYRGNLYNWYDTGTLEVLPPRFVSFVDSGNFICASEALVVWLEKDGDIRSSRLVKRLRTLIDGTELSFMYNKDAGLFHIGIDTVSGKLTDSCYDLFASEALLSSYYCISSGIVPAEHWRHLSRAACESGGRMYVKSWTGTMFEYFLPAVFLPAGKYTFYSEMLESAFTAQKKRNKKLPWGNSESGYYLFDEKLYYQYKAFGVRKLAFKRGMESENVISPYSSFLTLPFKPEASAANLRKLISCGMYGSRGFYEALDATPSRTGGEPTPVKMYMTHHLAMSFLAGMNYLKDKWAEKLFFSGDRSFFSELLEERLPFTATVMHTAEPDSHGERIGGRYTEIEHIDPLAPVCHMLTDKKYTVVLTDSGSGYSEYKGLRLSRFRDLTPEAVSGVFAAVRTSAGSLCATYAPLYEQNAKYKTHFGLSSAEYRAKGQGLETVWTVTVEPNSGCEIRTLTVKNLSPRKTDGSAVFYFEPVLTAQRTEEAHPAFSGLFVYGNFDPSSNILTVGRRRRMKSEKSGSIAVTLFDGEGSEKLFGYRLTRFDVLNRKEGGSGGTASFINAFELDMGASPGKTFPVDPCVCIKTDLVLRPFGSEKITLVIAAAGNDEEAKATLLKLRKPCQETASKKLRKMSASDLAALAVDRESMKTADILLNAILRRENNCDGYTAAVPSPYETVYSYGISGDLPLIFIRISESVCPRVLNFLKAYAILRRGGINAELLIGYGKESGYLRPITTGISGYIASLGLTEAVGKRGGIFLSPVKNENDFALLAGISCFFADPEKGWRAGSGTPPAPYVKVSTGKPVKIRYSYRTGIGGFVSGGNETGFAVDDKDAFPNRPPWSHVLANKRFGTLVSDNGLGFTYAGSASQFRLTPFTNDAVRDNDGEKLILTLGNVKYDILAGATPVFYRGRAVYMTEIAGIRVRADVFVCVNLPVKTVTVELDNTGSLPLYVGYTCEIIMGERKKLPVRARIYGDRIEYTSPCGQSDRDSTVIVACPGGSVSEGVVGKSCSAGDRLSAVFCLCYAATERRKRGLLSLIAAQDFSVKERKAAVRYWNGEGQVKISTPDKALDMFFNTFCAYQIKAARLFAKTGFYQCSGATGFRDQLQDSMALAFTEPEILRRQIIAACSHQFEKGDVLHWWHGGGDTPLRGSRSRSSDDMLWLPLAVSEYLERTDKNEILREQLPFVSGDELSSGVNEAYIQVSVTTVTAAVYEHAKKAIMYGLRTGSHGLLLFGSGDWNDGMNEVGGGGKGETVWGSLFAVIMLEKFAAVAVLYGEEGFADYCRKSAKALRTAVEASAWDGSWYLRGFFDSGEPLGSSKSHECRIDLICQSFAALAGGFDPYRVRSGLDNAKSCLTDTKNGVVKLLTPPFAESKNDPGYIMGYIPGVRENGGQYTHAAVWFAAALYKEFRYDEAYEILSLINPVNKAGNKSSALRYRTEPYVLAGDVYSVKGHEGMGGWSHYTGAAGWYYRTVLNDLLGLHIKGNRLFIEPALPDAWREFRVSIRTGGADIDVYVRKSHERKLFVDRKEASVIVLDGKNHEVVYQYLPV